MLSFPIVVTADFRVDAGEDGEGQTHGDGGGEDRDESGNPFHQILLQPFAVNMTGVPLTVARVPIAGLTGSGLVVVVVVIAVLRFVDAP